MTSLHPTAAEALDLARSVLGGARAGEEMEVFVQDATQMQVWAYQKDIENLKSARTRGLGIRVVSDGRLGYSYTSDLGSEALTRAVEEARANAESASVDEANRLPAPLPGNGRVPQIFDASALEVTPDQKAALALDLEARVLGGSDRIQKVTTARYIEAIAHIAIASTAGVEVAWSQNGCFCMVAAIAGDDEESQSGVGYSIARHLDKLDVQAAASEAIERAVRLIGAKKVPTAKVPVVLDAQATVALLQVLAASAAGPSVVKGRSLLAGKIGDQIASEILDITDDALMEDGVATRPFDGEGMPSRTTPVVEKGVFRSYLQNSWSAAKMQLPTTANGNRTYKSTPTVAPSNFHLLPGARSQQEIVSGVENGFYAQSLMGVHSGVNPVSGNFSVGATGLWIRAGAFAEPVREVTVASTLFDLLKGVQEVGSDVKVVPGGFLSVGSYGAPSVLIGEMTVAGS